MTSTALWSAIASRDSCLGASTADRGIDMAADGQMSNDVLQVKSLAESTGEVESATPSLAVQMVGLNSVPTAGDEFYVCVDETMARKAAEVAEDAQVPPPSQHIYSNMVWDSRLIGYNAECCKTALEQLKSHCLLQNATLAQVELLTSS
jgi:hypothetical protein